MLQKRIKSRIDDLELTQKRLQIELEGLQKAWADELVDLTDLREQVTNLLRRITQRARMAQDEETPVEPTPDTPPSDPISDRVMERRHGLRTLQGNG
jgi:uncharacterized coiled-coil protein SlyX